MPKDGIAIEPVLIDELVILEAENPELLKILKGLLKLSNFLALCSSAWRLKDRKR